MFHIINKRTVNKRAVDKLKRSVWRVSLISMSVVSVVLLLSSCASLQLPIHPKPNFMVIPASVRQARISTITHFQLAGSISIQTPDKSAIVHASWQQLGRNSYRIQLASSLNLYQLTLLSRYGHVTLWRSATQPLQAASAEELMDKVVGWSLPISNMFYWIRGLPAPGPLAATEFDRFGLLRHLAQQGWEIHYVRYTQTDGFDLPERIEMTRPGFVIDFAISRWVVFAN